MKVIVAAVLSLALAGPALAAGEVDSIRNKYAFEEIQQTARDLGVESPAPTARDFELLVDYRKEQEKNKLYESFMLCGALLISLVIVLRYITSKPNYVPAQLVNVSGLIFIIFGTIFLVLLTDSESQLTASMGIMGAIAGYLFGTMRRGDGQPAKQE